MTLDEKYRHYRDYTLPAPKIQVINNQVKFKKTFRTKLSHHL